jgi:hypothetical protein
VTMMGEVDSFRLFLKIDPIFMSHSTFVEFVALRQLLSAFPSRAIVSVRELLNSACISVEYEGVG